MSYIHADLPRLKHYQDRALKDLVNAKTLKKKIERDLADAQWRVTHYTALISQLEEQNEVQAS